MDEETAKQLWKQAEKVELSQKDSAAVDRWIKDYALNKLEKMIEVQTFALKMCRAHYGSIEVDALLQSLGCYPEWMK